jgi:hypothetical protein
MAMPISAAASAGASLMPSPTLGDHRALVLRQLRDDALLVVRQELGAGARCRAAPAMAGGAGIVAGQHDRRTPSAFSAARPAFASSRGSSRTAMDRRARPSALKSRTGDGLASSRRAASTAQARAASRLRHALPAAARCEPRKSIDLARRTSPVDALASRRHDLDLGRRGPGSCMRPLGGGEDRCAPAGGWSRFRAPRRARGSSSSASLPSATMSVTTWARPRSAYPSCRRRRGQMRLPSCSSTAPPFISRPWRAPDARAPPRWRPGWR